MAHNEAPGYAPPSGTERGPAVSRRAVLGVASSATLVGLLGPKAGRLLNGPREDVALGRIESGPSTSTVTAAIYASPNSLDPATIRLIPEYQVVSSLYDQLLWKLPGMSSKFYPGLATSYSTQDGGRSFTFELRKGVTFHDGTAFDANAVKYTFDRIVNPATKSISSLAVLGPYQETKVLGPYAAQVIFKAPNAGFLDNVASPLLAIVPPSAAKAGAAFARHPVGSGPFKFVSWTADLDVVLERNPDYRWGPPVGALAGPALPAKLVYRIITETASQVSALQTGEITVAQDLETAQVESLTAAGQYTKEVVTTSGMPYGFMMNVRKAPTNELAVRRAVEYAVNRDEVIKTLFNGLYSPANTVITPPTFGYNSKQFFSYDPDKAKSVLQGGGWTGSSTRSRNGTRLSVAWLLSEGFGFNDAAELIATQLQAVGIHSTISQEASPGVFTSIEKGVMNISSIFDYAADPFVLGELFGCAEVGVGPNYGHYCNPGVDNQITKANSTSSAAARQAIYQSIQATLMDAAVFIPIYNLANVYVHPKSLTGLEYGALAVPLFTAVK
jgi:peptide/nickel transport system substrate-binding protein